MCFVLFHFILFCHTNCLSFSLLQSRQERIIRQMHNFKHCPKTRYFIELGLNSLVSCSNWTVPDPEPCLTIFVFSLWNKLFIPLRTATVAVQGIPGITTTISHDSFKTDRKHIFQIFWKRWFQELNTFLRFLRHY